MVWIEIDNRYLLIRQLNVTTLRVVWIEIVLIWSIAYHNTVTTLRVVWIEIVMLTVPSAKCPCHHLAGGVD